jgi:NADPH2:quinone reductase
MAYVPGAECVGTVLESDTHAIGSLVYAECHASPDHPGAFADEVVVLDTAVISVPDGVDPVLAAAVGNSGIAAYLPLVDNVGLRPGDNVLVLGATGAVGQLAVQIALRLGAGRVVGVARSRSALDRVLALGADAVVELRPDETAYDLGVRLTSAAPDTDVVFDGIYGIPLEAALHACGRRARIVNVGNLAGPIASIPASLLRGKQLTISGFAGIHAPVSKKRAALSWLWSALARDELRLDVQTVSLDGIAEAWAAQAASPHAKFVVLPD